MHITPDGIMSQLNTCNYQAHKERNVPAVYGTCTWIFDDVRYNSWLAEFDSFLLWISADAGCGKSVLASFLVDHHKLESASQSNICYFFFKADSDQQGDALHALSALLHQLYKCQPELITIGMNILAEEDQKLGDLATLWKLLTGSVEVPHARPTICFVDGFDECEENTRKLFIKLITKYFTVYNEAENDKEGVRKRLKFLVTSRPDNSIKNAFDRQQPRSEATEQDQTTKSLNRKTRFAMMRLRGEDETEAISNDIELVIKHAIGDLGSRGLPDDLLEDMERALISRADRTFLWVTLIIQLLEERFEEGASRRELDAILRSRNVDAIYAVLLNSKANHLKARKMLNIILAAFEPLTVEELSIALAIRPDHQTFVEQPKPRRPSNMTFNDVERDLAYPFENHIKGLCGHFIRIIHQKVYLVHQSAREFLINQAFKTDGMDEEWWGMDNDIPGLDENMWSFDEDPFENQSGPYPEQQLAGETSTVMKSPGSSWRHTFPLIDAHAVLLEICVSFLYLLGRRSSKPGVMIGIPGPKVSGFLKYAANSWTKHFRRVCHRIQPHHLAYYHGLCHPKFPGFYSLFPESTRVLVRLKGFTDDELQDYIVHDLRLEPGDSGRRRNADFQQRTTSTMLSSNPTALQQIRFPVTVDNTGFVSLDFEATRKMFS
jgi:RNAse (barnase) inhibitor barstar